jgi:hypothetical protein
MSRRLSFGDVLAVVERVPDLSGIVLVGGQALNFWAERLGITSADTAGVFGPALSDDIDFLGSARAALAFGEATGGNVAVAGMDDAHSPNTALVTLDIEGERHLIDFLGAMKGFSAQELERVRQWAVPLKLPRGTPRPLYVMHPVHCLEAQLENVYGAALNRRDEPGGRRYVGRVHLAIEACRRIGEQHLADSQPRSALKLVEKIHELSMVPAAMRARFEDDIHVERGIPDASVMPSEFRDKRLPQLREQLERVARRYEERTRKKSRDNVK